MEKVSLNKFTQVANFDYIEEPIDFECCEKNVGYSI